MFAISRLQDFFAAKTAAKAITDGLPATALAARAGSSAAHEDGTARIPSRPPRLRRIPREITSLASPGMQHTLERDAIRVHSNPWLY